MIYHIKKGYLRYMALLLMGILLCIWIDREHEKKRHITIEFAMFNGSNWNVEVQDSYGFIDRAIEEFEKMHSEVFIHYASGIPKEEYSEWMGKRILSGNPPDVMMVMDEDFNRFCELEILESLDSYMEQDGDFHKEEYYETALASGKIMNRQYALPMETMPYLMFVNKTLLKEEGIEIPRDDYTFQELYDICKRVTKDKDGDGRLDQFGIFKYTWLEAAWANGGRLFSEDGKKCYFNDDAMLESVKFIKMLHELNGNMKVTKEMFDNGQVAFMPLSYAEYRTYKAYPYKMKKYTSFEWDCIAMPKGKMGNNISMVDSLNIAMSKKSKEKEVVWEFMKYMTGNEAVQEDMAKSMPAASVLKKVTEKDMPDEEGFINGKFIGEVIEHGRVKPKFEKYHAAVQMADGEINKLYSQDADLENSLRIIERKVEEYISR